MRVITGRVVGGKIEVETDLHLSPDEEEELVTALGDIQRGEFEDGRELLRELKGLPGR